MPIHQRLVLCASGLLAWMPMSPLWGSEVSESDAPVVKSSADTMAQGGYIAPPATTLMGKKPEARWIWDAGEINPRNTYLHVRKAFDLKEVPVSAVTYVSAGDLA